MPSTKPELHISDFFEEKARSGNGSYAIAFALLELADAHKKGVRAVERLGLNDGGGSMGAIEMLALEMKRVAEALTLLPVNWPSHSEDET